MRDWLKQRPWIWIVLFFVVVVLLNLIFVAVAVLNPPVPV